MAASLRVSVDASGHQPPFLVTILDLTGVGELLERPLPGSSAAESATA